MDYESTTSRKKGCWDPKTSLQGFVDAWTSTVPTPDFVVDELWRERVAELGFSGNVSPEMLAFWDETIKNVYSGEEGRKKLLMALINLLDRDGLLSRLRYVKCPVYWLQVSLKPQISSSCIRMQGLIRVQGPEDPVFGRIVPTEQIKLFTSSPDAKVTFVEGADHYLNATSPKETEEAILKMVQKHPQQYKL